MQSPFLHPAHDQSCGVVQDYAGVMQPLKPTRQQVLVGYTPANFGMAAGGTLYHFNTTPPHASTAATAQLTLPKKALLRHATMVPVNAKMVENPPAAQPTTFNVGLTDAAGNFHTPYNAGYYTIFTGATMASVNEGIAAMGCTGGLHCLGGVGNIGADTHRRVSITSTNPFEFLGPQPGYLKLVLVYEIVPSAEI